MKKPIILSLLIILLGGLLIFVAVNKPSGNNDLTTVRVAEVAHTIFYAPYYVAIEKGFFEEEGIEIDSILTPGADRVMAAVLSNDVQIGFAGSEATIYVYKQGEENFAQVFAGLTKRDGTFIVGRENIEDFTLEHLRGRNVIGGRKGGMPQMTLEHTLRQAGLDPDTDVNINTEIAFPAMAGAFIGGEGDFVTLFEPTALHLEQEGFGYVLASVGELGGEMPYTSFFARISYLEDNEELILSFTRAVQRGLDFVAENDAETIAEAIFRQFPDTSMNDLIKIVERYKNVDSWVSSVVTTEASFNHLQNVMIEAGELQEKAPFSRLVNNSFAKKVTE